MSIKNRYQKLALFFLCISLNFLSLSAKADVSSDLSTFFNNLGYSTNTTAPNAYQGQQAGYYMGGSIFARSSGRDVQIAEVELPSFRSGCGGIDLFTGGFSFINAKALVSTMQNIMSNAVGYAFNLALESATPEIANAMKYMNTLANEINKASVNSCETAAGLVGSVWPRTHAAQKSVCEDIGTQQGIFSDYADARQGCGNGGEMESTLNQAADPYKNFALNKGNLAWKALQSNGLFSGDTQLAEFLMSLSGTLIINNQGADQNKDKDKQQYKILPSLASDQSLLKALLYGGRANIYVCDTEEKGECLNPTLQSISISSEDGLSSHVSKMLNDMVSKIYADTALSSDEIGLLNATALPVYKILNVQAAFSANSSVLNVQDYANVIASDILFQYLNENLSAVKTSSASMQYPPSLMEPYLKGIEEARNDIRQLQGSAYTQMNMAAQLINQTQTLEQMLAGSLSSRLNGALTWANNLRGA